MFAMAVNAHNLENWELRAAFSCRRHVISTPQVASFVEPLLKPLLKSALSNLYGINQSFMSNGWPPFQQ
jgi:hypothetical protein